MRKFLAILTITALLATSAAAVELFSPSAVLMEKSTGRVLFEKDSHTPRAPASVTKVMTLLLAFEALDSGKIALSDMVTVSQHAAGMGGSQVFLEVGEQMSVDDMLKAIAVSSGNDAAVALGEHISGSHESFVGEMNERARSLGMRDTAFKNCTGLDADGHVTSAADIAIMSRELLKHEKVKEYSGIWMDTLRDGAFGLSNTNKLLKSYSGITGLKTGSTDKAKFCMSATAERDGMELIASVMGAPSSKERFADAAALLDYGFANFSLYEAQTEPFEVRVILGEKEFIIPRLKGEKSVLTAKDKRDKISERLELAEDVRAPVEEGQKLGELVIESENEVIAAIPIVAAQSVARLDIMSIFRRLLAELLMK